MIDNASLLIEELKLKTGSYKDAFLLLMEKQDIHDPEDLLEVISPILYAKIKQEFRDLNHFGPDSPHKKESNLEEFF
jgi:hypothetical protein